MRESDVNGENIEIKYLSLEDDNGENLRGILLVFSESISIS